MDWNTVAINHQQRERERFAYLHQLASNSIRSSTNSNLSNHNFQYGLFPTSNNISQHAPQMNQIFIQQGASTSSAHHGTTNENDCPSSSADKTATARKWIVPTDTELDNFKPSNAYYASKKKLIEALKVVFEGSGRFLVQFIADFHSRIKGLAWVGEPLFKKLGMDEQIGTYKKTDKECPMV
jgi:hypothetical protein